MNYSNLTAEQQMVAEAKKFVNKKHRELTQAEYDALSVEEKNNGTVYFVTDSENPSVDTYTKSEIDVLFDNKVDKAQGKGLSTNDFTDNYKKGISISQELAYDKSKEYIPSSDADFHNVGDGEIFTKDGVTYSIRSIIQNPKTKEYIYTLSYSGHPTHGYAFAKVKDPTSDRDDWNILKPSGIVAHQIPCVSERFDGYVRFYSVYVDTSGEEQVSTLIYSDDLYEWRKMDVESVTVSLYQMGNNAFCYTDKLYEIDGLQILPTDLPYEPLKIAYGGGRLVVLTSNRSIYMSYDGIQWELKGTSIYSGDIIYGNGIFLIYSYEEDTVYVSKDGGYIWETQSVTVYNGDNVNPNEREVYEYYFPFREIGYAGGIFFGTSGYHKQGQSLSEDLYGIWTSKDGYNWEITATDIEEEYKVTDNLYNETYIINTKNNLYYPTLSVGDALDAKVDKVTGKGLSTNDYTNSEKQKNADNASAIEDIQEDISQSQTATGNPITIESSESNLVECTAEVEAVQDLHGYDHPWVGGAGKNKLPMTVDGIKSANTSGTWSGNVYTYNGVSFTILTDLNNNITGIKVNGTASATSFFVLNTNLSFTVQTILNGNTLPNASESNCLRFIDGGGNSRTDLGSGVSIPANFAGQTQIRLNRDYSVSNIILYPMIRLSTETDSSFAPYSNISPIIGQTEVVIEDVGKNLFDKNGTQTTTYGTATIDGEKITCTGTYYARIALDLPAGIYTVSCEVLSFSTSKGIRLFYDDNTYSDTVMSSGTINTNGKRVVAVLLYCGDGTYATTVYQNIQIEKGSTATTYEPYKGKTYTIQLGDTIYGGELDVLTGELTVTHGEVDLGTLNWIYQSQYSRFYTPYSPAKAINNQQVANAICSQYIVIDADSAHYPLKDNVIAISQSKNIIIVDTDYSDSTTFKNAINGVQLVYELAEPYTIQLTPQQIRLLKGTNHLSCNTGDLSIKYYPDNVLGQLKGDIEGEYDERVETLETQVQELQPSLIFMSRERRDITSDLSRLSIAVAEQNLAKYGYKIGDYFTGASGYTYILADYNTFKGTSTPYCISTNHIGIVVDTHQTLQWHSGDASAVGYNGSTLHTYLKGTVLDTIKTDFKALFSGSTGLEHLIAHSKLFTTALANWAWQANQYISALTCTQIDAGSQWTTNGFQEGEASKSLELFRKHKWTEIFGNEYPWLRDLSNHNGGLYACGASPAGNLTGNRSVLDSFFVVGLINFY